MFEWEKVFNGNLTTNGQIIAKIKEIESTKLKMRMMEAKENNLQVDFDEDKQKLQKEKLLIQKECKHYSKTYYPDASGNNDSYTECDVCGKRIQR